MRWTLGLRAFAALVILPFALVVAGTLQMASQGRHAFKEMTATLGALAETTRLEEKIRKGINGQLVSAMNYLQTGTEDSWSQFTRLAWSVYEEEARYLALPLTPEERLAVERVRTQHRLFEGMAQSAMARRAEASVPEDPRRIQEAFDQVEDAIEEVSRMIQGRLATATATAGDASSRTGSALAALALLFTAALVLSWTLALRGVLAPLEALGAATARLAHGDLSARAPEKGLPAVAQLCQRFNAMAAELEALLQRLEERVEARTAQLAALESLSRAGLANLDRDSLLRTVIERMSAAAGADGVSLRLIENGLLVRLAHEGLPEELLQSSLPLGLAPGSRALEMNRAAWVEDISDEPDAARLLQLGFRSIVVAPLTVRDRALGLVTLFFRSARPRDPDLIRVLEAMAARAAMGLERAEMVQQILRNAEELRTANQRLIETQQRLLDAERLAAVGEVHIALRHEINNPLSVLVGAAEILQHQSENPEVVRSWAGHLAEATSRITDVLRRLEELRRVPTTDYGAGVAMVDLGKEPEKPI